MEPVKQIQPQIIFYEVGQTPWGLALQLELVAYGLYYVEDGEAKVQFNVFATTTLKECHFAFKAEGEKLGFLTSTAKGQLSKTLAPGRYRLAIDATDVADRSITKLYELVVS